MRAICALLLMAVAALAQPGQIIGTTSSTFGARNGLLMRKY